LAPLFWPWTTSSGTCAETDTAQMIHWRELTTPDTDGKVLYRKVFAPTVAIAADRVI
jgi:hypothetical protein